MKKIKVGIIGVGFISQICHIPNICNNKKFEVVAFADLDKSLLNKVGSKYNIKNLFTNYHEMISIHKDLELIYVILPRTKSLDIYLDILKYDKYIFIEKPLINISQQLKKIKINPKNKLFKKTVIGYMKRFDESYLYLKKNFPKFIKKFGSVKYVSFNNLTGNSYYGEKNYIQRGDYNKYIKNLKKNNFLNEQSIFINNFSHDIDLIFNLFGKNIFIHGSHSNKSGTLLLKNIKSNFLISFFYQINSKKKNWTEEIIIYFEKACIKLNLPAALAKNQSGYIEINDYNSNEFKKVIFDTRWSFINQIDELYRFVNGKINGNLCTFTQAINNIEIVNHHFKK